MYLNFQGLVGITLTMGFYWHLPRPPSRAPCYGTLHGLLSLSIFVFVVRHRLFRLACPLRQTKGFSDVFPTYLLPSRMNYTIPNRHFAEIGLLGYYPPLRGLLPVQSRALERRLKFYGTLVLRGVNRRFTMNSASTV